MFPGALTTHIYPDILWCITANYHHSKFAQIELAYSISWASRFKLISVANQIDNKLSKKQCIYAYLSRVDYLNFASGVDKAAEVYYNRSLRQLNEKECIELVIMSINPSLYNKVRNPELLEEKVRKVMAEARPIS